jgi:putative heme iron utilization protein
MRRSIEGESMDSQFIGRSLAVCVALALPLSAGAADLCASAADRAAAAAELARGKGAHPYYAGAKLGMSEARFASALPADRRVGVPGTEFEKVWKLMTTWRDPGVAVRKAESVFLVRGPLPPGAMSVLGTQWFNLDLNTPHLTGHLRPDQIAVIYATKLPTNEGGEAGSIFAYDANGVEVFSVTAYPDGTPQVGKIPVIKKEDVAALRERLKSDDPSAHEHDKPAGGYFPKEFLATFDAMKAMPQVCKES